MITLETFSPNNRKKVIGNSLYKICQSDQSGKWYIHEFYTTTEGAFAMARGYFSSSLEDTINRINNIDQERELTEKKYASEPKVKQALTRSLEDLLDF